MGNRSWRVDAFLVIATIGIAGALFAQMFSNPVTNSSILAGNCYLEDNTILVSGDVLAVTVHTGSHPAVFVSDGKDVFELTEGATCAWTAEPKR